MFVGFHHARFDSLAKLWNSCLPDAYAISPDTLKANSVDCPVFDWGASTIQIDDDAKVQGFVIVKRSAAQLYKGPDPDQAHICAVLCPQPRLGVDLLAFVKQNMVDRGIYKLVFGQDSQHLFAACPTDIPSLKDLLTIEGFEAGGEFYDVQQDLKDFSPRDSAAATLAKPEVRVSRVKPGETLALQDFMKKEFPGRWAYDVAMKVDTEGGPGFVFGLWQGDKLNGFAMTQDSRQKLPIAGAVYHQALGKDWCTLGPIGIAKEARGKGLGDALLAGALLEMKEEGKRNCLVDWTVLTDWYGKHGFKPCRTYVPLSLRLDEGL